MGWLAKLRWAFWVWKVGGMGKVILCWECVTGYERKDDFEREG